MTATPAVCDHAAAEIADLLISALGPAGAERFALASRACGPPPVRGFGDLDFEHGAAGPYLGSDENDTDSQVSP